MAQSRSSPSDPSDRPSPGAGGTGPGRRFWAVPLIGVALFFALVVVAAVVMRRPAPGERPLDLLAGKAAGYNVLLITIDTARVDCFGCYGHTTVRTPNIDRLAAEGARFVRCASAAPITLPSHASIMTGTYPFVHRVRNNGRYLADDGNETLAERLKAAGYTTGAEVGAFVLDAIWGLNQGFDSYRRSKEEAAVAAPLEEVPESQSVPADDVCDRAVEWLSRHGEDRFFLWVHFFDPHVPYDPPGRFARQYSDAYLGEIAFVDEQVGRLIAHLRETGVADRTVVVVVSDHGEGRGDHGELTHVYYVYDSTMRVPLIFWCPSLIPGGRVVGGLARTVDIAPTVLDLLGAKGLAHSQGASLLPRIEGRRDATRVAYGESASARDSFGYARLRTLWADGWKYIHAPKPELYDLSRDPGETQNAVTRFPERVAAMRERLRVVIVDAGRSTGAADASRLDADAVERLAALGYVGGYAPKSDSSEEQLLSQFEGPDPKDHIKAYNAFLGARAFAEEGAHAVAGRMLLKLVSAEPRNPAFRMLLAEQLRRLGQPAEAAEQLSAVLAIQPDNTVAVYRLGKVLGDVGRLDESVDYLTRAVEAMPDYADAHAYLALALQRKHDWEGAERHFRRALALNPRHEEAFVGLGATMYGQGRVAEAVSFWRRGLQVHADSVQLANNLAWCLATCPDAAIRDGDEAVRIAERVCQDIGTKNPAVMDTLAAAYAEAGRMEDAVRTARSAVRVAEALEQSALAAAIGDRLELYESGRPYREAH